MATDDLEDVVAVVAQAAGCEVDVPGGATGSECGQERTAFEDELLGVVTGGQPGEEPFKHVELDQFIGQSAVDPGFGSKV